MKKALKIFVSILLIIIVALGVFVYTQWNSIEAFIDAVKYSNEEVSKNLTETKNQIQQILDNEDDITVRDLTEEESRALIEGELGEDEIIAIITGKEEPQSSEGNPPKVNDPPQETENSEKESNEIISELIAKLYVQKSTYLNKLDVIEEEARAEYLSKDLKSKPRKERKEYMLPKYLPIVADWERECDSMVYGAIDQIRQELKKLGKDESIADDLKNAYLEEKRAKKAYFINRYMD